MRRIIVVGLIALISGLVGCDKKPTGESSPQPSAQPPPLPATTPPPPVASAPEKPVVKPTAEFKIASVGNTMLYDVTTFTVSAGQPVHLVLTNHSTMMLLPHNWLLVKPGTEASVAAAGLKMGEDAGYIDSTNENVLAVSPMAAMGKTVEFTFTAPTTPGTYPYICTVPGHYLKMKGTLVVTS